MIPNTPDNHTMFAEGLEYALERLEECEDTSEIVELIEKHKNIAKTLEVPTVKVECPLTEDEAQDLVDGTRNITFHHPTAQNNIEIEVLSPLLQDESIDEAVARHQAETEEE